MHSFSVIIPVRSYNAFLEENIAALKKLTYPKFEVLIVFDENPHLDFADSRFKILVSGRKSPGEKRNIGASAAVGNVLAFLDDDAYPREDWLACANELFDKYSLYALGGPSLTPKSAPFAEKMSGVILESILASASIVHRYKPCKEMFVDDYPTVNLFIKKDAFMAVGGFCTDFWPGEDTKLCLDLVEQTGKKFMYHPNPIVYHHRRQFLLPHLKQISRYGSHRGQFARIFPRTSRVPRYFIPSIFVLGLISGPFLANLWLPFGFIFYSTLWLYTLVLLGFSLNTVFKEKNVMAGLYFFSGVLLTHIVYGINFIVGFVKRPRLQLRVYDKATGNYLGG